MGRHLKKLLDFHLQVFLSVNITYINNLKPLSHFNFLLVLLIIFGMHGGLVAWYSVILTLNA